MIERIIRRCAGPLARPESRAALRASAILGALAFFAMVPVEAIAQGPNLCLVRWMFGVECLGCGMTRALAAVLHGDVALALRYNRLVVVPAAILAVMLVRDLYASSRDTMRGHERQSPS